jgi:hypothetical protein
LLNILVIYDAIAGPMFREPTEAEIAMADAELKKKEEEKAIAKKKV